MSRVKPGFIRCFAHVSGFGDETDYIKCLPSGQVFIVRHDGSERQAKHFTFCECLNFVEKGIWKEVSRRVPIPLLQEDKMGNITLVYSTENCDSRQKKLLEIAETAIKADFFVNGFGFVYPRNGLAAEELVGLCQQLRENKKPTRKAAHGKANKRTSNRVCNRGCRERR